MHQQTMSMVEVSHDEMNRGSTAAAASDESQLYNAKLRQLKPWTERLRLGVQQFRMDDNERVAQKLETMLGVVEGRR